MEFGERAHETHQGIKPLSLQPTQRDGNAREDEEEKAGCRKRDERDAFRPPSQRDGGGRERIITRNLFFRDLTPCFELHHNLSCLPPTLPLLSLFLSSSLESLESSVGRVSCVR